MSNREHGIYDQQILNLYLNMYERTINQIDLLYEDLSQIREIINSITGVSIRNQNTSGQTPVNNVSVPTTPVGRSNTVRISNHNLSEWFRQLASRENETVNNLFTPSFFPNNFFDRVPVPPTQQQIENATSTVCFSEVENPPYANCPITLDVFNVNSNVTQFLYCRHIFDSVAIQNWFRNSTYCPVCRFDIRNYVRPVIVNEESVLHDNGEQETETMPTPRHDLPPTPIQVTTPTQAPEVNLNETAGNREGRQRRNAQLLQNMVDNLPVMNEDEILNTFTNATSSILNSFFSNMRENPISLDNANYHIDASDNLIFESHLRNIFR